MSQESEFEELLESAYHHTINEFGLENVKDNVGLLGHAGQLEWTRTKTA